MWPKVTLSLTLNKKPPLHLTKSLWSFCGINVRWRGSKNRGLCDLLFTFSLAMREFINRSPWWYNLRNQVRFWYASEQHFSTLPLLTFRVRYPFVVGAALCIIGCFVAFGFNSPDSCSPPSTPIVTNKNVSRHCQLFVMGAKVSPGW